MSRSRGWLRRTSDSNGEVVLVVVPTRMTRLCDSMHWWHERWRQDAQLAATTESLNPSQKGEEGGRKRER